jgi:Skp family chaperone for outer membrane proteins
MNKLFLIILLLFPLVGAAQTYRYIDHAGTIHWVDSLKEVPEQYRYQALPPTPTPNYGKGGAKQAQAEYKKKVAEDKKEYQKKKKEYDKKKKDFEKQKIAEQKKKERDEKALAEKLERESAQKARQDARDVERRARDEEIRENMSKNASKAAATLPPPTATAEPINKVN